MKSLPMIETERCSGHCCQKFSLRPPDEMKRLYDEWVTYGRRPGHDIEKVWPMLIHLGKFDVSPSGTKLNPPLDYYTCKHYNTATGNCDNYENRPRMCSEYPYGGTCTYTDCTRREVPQLGPVEADPWESEVSAAKIDEEMATVAAELSTMVSA